MIAPREIIDLVERFNAYYSYFKVHYSYDDIKNEFVSPLFEALGWDVHNRDGKPPYMKDVLFNKSHKTRNGQIHTPDYTFSTSGDSKLLVEVVEFSEDLGDYGSLIEHIRKYGGNVGLSLLIITNFKELVVCDIRFIPHEADDFYTIRHYSYEDYITSWDEISKYFSKSAVDNNQHLNILQYNNNLSNESSSNDDITSKEAVDENSSIEEGNREFLKNDDSESDSIENTGNIPNNETSIDDDTTIKENTSPVEELNPFEVVLSDDSESKDTTFENDTLNNDISGNKPLEADVTDENPSKQDINEEDYSEDNDLGMNYVEDDYLEEDNTSDEVINEHDPYALYDDIFGSSQEDARKSRISDGHLHDKVLAIISEVEKKMKSNGVSLILSTKFFHKKGIVVSCRDAFIIDDITRYKLIKEDSHNRDIIRPVLERDDIIENNSLHEKYMINTKEDTPIRRWYPVIYEYLEKFRQELEESGKTGREWYNVAMYPLLIDRSKIICTVKDRNFYTFLDTTGEYALFDSEYFIYHKNNDKFVLEILNAILSSNLVKFYVKEIYFHNTDMFYFGVVIKRIPIINIVKDDPKMCQLHDLSIKLENLNNVFENLKATFDYNNIQSSHVKYAESVKSDIEELRYQVNKIVYDLYDISEEHREIIDMCMESNS